MHAGEAKNGSGQRGKRWQIHRRQIRNDQAGGETRLKMHAGMMKKGRGQRAHGDKFLPATVKTIAPSVKRH
ncbi:MAG: hypothetical protein ACLR23_13430 [Clostridia bacterium]